MKPLAHTPAPAGGSEILDARPIALPGFELRARSAVARGRPTLEQWTNALAFASAAAEAAPYWVGDLLNYADDREDWNERVDQAKAATGLAHQTIINASWLARAVATAERELAPTPAHAAEVASLPVEEQREVLTEAREKGWTRRETRSHVKARKRARVIEGQASLIGMYRVMYADPPWEYRQSTPLPSGALARASQHYPSMSIADLCKLPVEAHAMPHAVLWLWVPSSLLLQNPGPREVIDAWGFDYKTLYVWDKVHGMPGNYSYVNHEQLVVATRGQGTPDVPINEHDFDSVVTVRREGEHSEKPEEFRAIIRKLYTTGPYLELFGRRPVEGWTVFGNDARLWADAQEG